MKKVCSGAVDGFYACDARAALVFEMGAPDVSGFEILRGNIGFLLIARAQVK